MKINLPLSDKDTAFLRKLVNIIIMQEVKDGNIALENIEDGTYIEKTRLRMSDKESFKIVIATDYTSSILTKARRERQKHPQESILHYTLYIEHKINAIIRILSDRKELDDTISLGLIRELKLSSKATWVLHLLNGKMFDEIIVRKINQISDQRNAYAHYKWKVTDPDNTEEKKSQ